MENLISLRCINGRKICNADSILPPCFIYIIIIIIIIIVVVAVAVAVVVVVVVVVVVGVVELLISLAYDNHA